MAIMYGDPFDGIKKVTVEEYHGSRSTQYTNDGLWTLEELQSDVDDECLKAVPIWLARNPHVAVFNEDLLKYNILSESIKEQYDLVLEYNTASAKDTSKYGIAMFDQWLHTVIDRILKENKVVK